MKLTITIELPDEEPVFKWNDYQLGYMLSYVRDYVVMQLPDVELVDDDGVVRGRMVAEYNTK